MELKTMKLRLRSLDSKQTLAINVPNSSSFLQLKETIFHSLSSSSSSLPSPSYLHLSFNRNDEIKSSSPHDSLHSLGITDGDLLFFTPNPSAFSLQTLIHKPTSDIDMTDAPSIPEPEKSPTLDVSEAETMDMVDGSVAVAVTVSVFKRNSQNSFLKSVLSESLGNDVNDFKLLFSAVHAVLLESGFVLVDNTVAEFSYAMLHSAKLLKYSLPKILNNNSSEDIITVNLKFQTLGHFISVYGSLSFVTGSELHSACLDKCKFARPLAKMLKNSESESDNDEIFELWKMVKDKLALPLLIDICDEAGLKLPPCFTRLPSEIKLKILECIPGVDLAKASCVCKELKHISSSDDLWKLKFKEEFDRESGAGKDFKDSFVILWKIFHQKPFQPSGGYSSVSYNPSFHFQPPSYYSYTPDNAFRCPCCQYVCYLPTTPPHKSPRYTPNSICYCPSGR